MRKANKRAIGGGTAAPAPAPIMCVCVCLCITSDVLAVVQVTDRQPSHVQRSLSALGTAGASLELGFGLGVQALILVPA